MSSNISFRGTLLLAVFLATSLHVSAQIFPPCYTYTTTVPATSCPKIVCPPIPQCILYATTTETLPPPILRCPITPTATETSTCGCQHGCATAYTTVTETDSCYYDAITGLVPSGSGGGTLISASFPNATTTAPATIIGGIIPTTLATAVSPPASPATFQSASCFTATTTVENPACSAFPLLDCVRVDCVVETVLQIPGYVAGCAPTPTVTALAECVTECPAGCGTFTLTETVK